MFEIDLGTDGSDINKFLSWSARGTLDGVIPPRTFYIREGANKTAVTTAESKGFVLDIDSLKTGWQKSDGVAGVAPEWKWNPSLAQMQASPGEDWKKGFSIKIALGKDDVGMWEQSGAAAWGALSAIVPQLKEQPAPGKMPLVKLLSVKDEKYTKGSTTIPLFTVTKWVDKPDCLKEGAAAGVDLGDTPAPQKVAQPAPQPAPAPVDDDDEEF